MSIQKKVVISILFTGLIALSVGLFVTYYQVRDILTDAIGRDFAEIAEKTAERFDATVKEEINTFQRLAEEPSFIMAVKEQRRKAIEDYLTHYMRHEKEREEHLGLFVVNGEGRIIADSRLNPYNKTDNMPDNKIDQSNETFVLHGNTKDNENPPSPPFFKGGKGGFSDEIWWKVTYNDGNGKLYASDMYLDKSGGGRALDIGIPVLDPATGRVIGGIRSIMNVDVFFRFIKEMSFGRTGHGMLVDSEGTPLICSLLPLIEHSMNQPLISLITEKGGGWAVAADDAHGGKNSIIGFSPVEYINSIGNESLSGHKWYTFIRQAPEETFTPVNRLMLKVLLLEFIIVLSISALGVYIVRRLLLQPVSILNDGVERISKGNLDHQIDIHTGDELESLANGFNRMSEELKRFYDNLEERIRERTASLRASETKYRALLEQAYDAVFLINPDNGQIVEVNLQAEILTGLSKEELLDIKYWDLYPQQMVNQAAEQFNKGVRRGFATLHDVTIKKKDDEIARVDMSARLIEYNKVKVYHAVMRDITERKKGEEKLSMTSEQLARSTMVMLEQDTRIATIRQEIKSLIKHINMQEIFVSLFKLIADRSGITHMALFEQTGEAVRCNWVYSLDDKIWHQVNVRIGEDDPIHDAIRNLRVVRKGDFNKESQVDRYFGDWAGFPLRVRDRVIGALVIGPMASDSKKEILQTFVDIVAMVLEKDGMIKSIKV